MDGWKTIRLPFWARYVFRGKIALKLQVGFILWGPPTSTIMVSWVVWIPLLDPSMKAGIGIVIFLGLPRFECQTTGVPLTIGWQAPHVDKPPKLHRRSSQIQASPQMQRRTLRTRPYAACAGHAHDKHDVQRQEEFGWNLVEFWGEDIWKLNMKTHETLQKVSGKKELLFRRWQFKFESSQLMFSPCLFFLLPRSSVAPSLIFLQFAGVMAVFFIYSKPLFTPEAK